MRHSWLPLIGCVLLIASCTDRSSPVAPTPVAGPTPPVATPPLPTTVPGVLAIGMPIEPGDSANAAYGIAPFGYHGADHALDGHPGWDIEYRIGGVVRAAAAGTIQNVFPDPFTPGRTTVQIEHIVGTHHYRTVYTNIATLAADIAENASVRAGQAIGTAGTISGTIGTQQVSYAMTHFQLDDLEFHREGPDPKAVSPEPFLTPAAKSIFDGLWSRAAFVHELVEPFATNPRALSFPASRTWTRAGGDGPAGIRFTRSRSQVAEYEYALLAESGTVIEAGAVAINVTARPYPLIALTSPTAVRLGLYDIVSNEMRLSLAPPGSARATDLTGASVYRTPQ
jgi:hypothetical protein